MNFYEDPSFIYTSLKAFFDIPIQKEQQEVKINIPRFTYRRNFTPIPKTRITNDSGWGCCYRCSQGILGLYLRRLYKIKPEFSAHEYLSSFLDIPDAMFSIHSLVSETQKLGVQPGNWAKPSQLSAAIVNILQKHNLSGINALNSTIEPELLEKVSYPCLILIPLLCGLSKFDESLFSFVYTCLQLPQSLGIVSGYFGSAYFLVGCSSSGTIAYFDPHVLQEAATTSNDFSTFFNQPIHQMKVSELNPSMLFGFFASTYEEATNIAKTLSEVQNSPILFASAPNEDDLNKVLDIDDL